MRLFKSEVFRNFAIGFVAAAAVIVGANARDWTELSSPAHAAQTFHMPEPSPDFAIPADIAR